MARLLTVCNSYSIEFWGISGSSLVSVFCLFFAACIIPEEEPPRGVQLDLSDETSQRIIDFQDRRLTDSLLVYMSHEDPTYRFLSARAFGSYTDAVAIDSLISLLSDPFDLVREQAAYALGQQGEDRALPDLINAFENGQDAYKFERSNGAILEAVGKLGSENELNLLSTIDHYLPTDTLLLNGQARGIMHLGRRGISSTDGTRVQLNLATDVAFPVSTRVAAADYLARYPKKLTNNQVDELANYLSEADIDAADRILVRALARLSSSQQTSTLARLFNSDDSWVKIQLLIGLPDTKYESFWPALRKSLVTESNHLVRVAIAEWLLENGQESEATTYAKLAQDSLEGREKYLMYAAAQRYLPYYLADYRTSINYELQRQFEQAEDPYEKAQILSALGEFPWNYRIIHNYGYSSEDAVVSKSAVEAIRMISNFERFDDFFGVSRRRVRTEISVYMREAVSSGQVGMMYEAALAIKEHPEFFRPYFDQLNWMASALSKLEKPRDLEAHTELSAAFAALQNRPVETNPQAVAFNHPIDWSVLATAGSEPEVRIRTNRGNMSIRLFPDLAPATVATFIQLVNSGFYDGLFIHRVAPAWVTQGGDPLGHGIGAGEFSLRTETPSMYYDQMGMVGAPRLDRDTESVQFFITHGATPSLDGRYTIFGQVIEGLELLAQLRIGDQIEGTELR
ncbi:MAG: peptidylprolyl isomerase [Bacteroidota bacterium]